MKKCLLVLIIILQMMMLASCQKERPVISDNGAQPLFNLKVDLHYSNMIEEDIDEIKRMSPVLSIVFYQSFSPLNSSVYLPQGQELNVRKRIDCPDYKPEVAERDKVFEASCDLEEDKYGFRCIHYGKKWLFPKIKKNTNYRVCLYLHDKHDKEVVIRNHILFASSSLRLRMNDHGYYYQQGMFDHEEPETDNRHLINADNEATVSYYLESKSRDQSLDFLRYFPYNFLRPLIITPFYRSSYMRQFKHAYFIPMNEEEDDNNKLTY